MMKPILPRIVWAACLAVLLAATATAQEDQPVKGEEIFIDVSGLGTALLGKDETKRHVELAEDMEIMGRLLEEALEVIYASPRFAAGPHSLSVRIGPSGVVCVPLSSYLEGYGIVFQTEASLPKQVVEYENGVSKRDGCPFLARSPWERMEIRVQSGNPSKQTCQNCHNPAPSGANWFLSRSNGGSTARPTREQLVDEILQVLAENGHNVRHLKSEERITCALAFHLDENADTIPVHEKQGLLLSKEAAKAAQQAYVEFSMGQPYLQQNRDSQPLAGDLLLNTRQYNKAIAAYQKALEKSGVKDLFQHTPDAGQRRIYRQLLQAHVGAGNLEEAQNLIAILRAGEVKATPAKKSPPPLPSRLVVSATKAQLDQVAGGEISREEFAKQAKVHFFEGRGGESSKQAKGDWKDLIDPKTGGILYDAAPIEIVQPAN